MKTRTRSLSFFVALEGVRRIREFCCVRRLEQNACAELGRRHECRETVNLFAVVGTHSCEDYWCSNPHTWRLNTSRISRGYLEAGSISIKRCAIVGGDRRVLIHARTSRRWLNNATESSRACHMTASLYIQCPSIDKEVQNSIVT